MSKQFMYQVSCFREDRTGNNEVLAFDNFPKGIDISRFCDPTGPLRCLVDGFGFPDFDERILSVFKQIPDKGGYLAVSIGDFIIAMLINELIHV